MIFISDLHLDSADSPKYTAFLNVLKGAVANEDSVFILGDLVEVWIGDDDDSRFATHLLQDLSSIAKETSVKLMHGNRDFLYRQSFTDQTGVEIIPDPFVLESDEIGESVLLTHGDAYCTSDEEYMRVRTLFRDKAWQDGILSSTLEDRRALANNLRQQSRDANQLKAENITDVVVEELAFTMTKNDCRLAIHGHTHRPGIHRVAEDKQRIVLGDWHHCGWLLRSNHGSFQLERFAIS